MRGLITALALALALAPGLAAQPTAAAVRTLEIQIADLVESGDFFGEIGVTGPDPTTITARVSFDTEAAPHGENQFRNSRYDYDVAFRPYLSFEVMIGDVILDAAPSLSTTDAIRVQDGLADGTGDIQDRVEIVSTTDQTNAGGAVLANLGLHVYDSDETLFSGTAVPDLATLSAIDGLGYFYVFLSTDSGLSSSGPQDTPGSRTITFSEITSEVPLPAGLPLLLAGLGGLGWIAGRCRGAA